MKIATISKKSFKNLGKRVERIRKNEKNVSLHISEILYFTNENNILEFHCGCFQNYREKFESVGEAVFGSFQIKTFKKIADSIDDDVTITIEGNNIVFNDGEMKFRANFDESLTKDELFQDFPTLPEDIREGSKPKNSFFVYDWKEFCSTLKESTKFMTKPDINRSYSGCFLLQEKDEKKTDIVATDTKRINVSEVDFVDFKNKMDDWNDGIIINSSICKSLPELFSPKEFDSMSVDVFENNLVIKTENREYVTDRLVKNDFPNYKKIMSNSNTSDSPSKKGFSISVDDMKKKISKVIKIMKGSGNKFFPVFFDFLNSKLFVDTIQKDGDDPIEMNFEIDIDSMNDNNLETMKTSSFESSFLKDFLDNCDKGEKFFIDVSETEDGTPKMKPIICEFHRKARVDFNMIMPVKDSDEKRSRKALHDNWKKEFGIDGSEKSSKFF